MAIISRLAVLLGLDAGEFNANLGKAKGQVEGFGLGAKLSLAAVGTAFAATAKEAISFADKINDVAKANEMSVQSILRMSQALSTNGGNADDAGKLMASFANKIDEAAQGSEKAQKAFLSIGVSLQDLRTLAPQELFEKTLKSLAAIEDPLKRNAMAMDMLGRGIRGVDIKGMADEFEKSKNKFENSDESFKRIGDSVDRLDRFFLNLKVSLAERVAPAFDYLTRAMENWQKKSQDMVDRFAQIKKEAGWWAAWKDKEGIEKYNIGEKQFGSVQGANVPSIMSGIGGTAAPRKDIRDVIKAKDKDAEAEAKKLKEALERQKEFYDREMLITQAKGLRLQKENELAFLTQNERNLQLELFDIEQKRQQLTLGDQFGRKMSEEQAKRWADAEKARAKEAYQIGEAQRSFEFGWKKAFAAYTDTATNAALMGEQAFVSLTQNMEQALDQFVRTGKLSFSDLARSIISDLIAIQMRAQATAIFKSSGLGDIFSSFFGGGGGGSPVFGSTAFWGGKADGGNVSSNNSYMVGERGPELFIPNSSGTIIPNHQLGSMGNQPQVVYNGPYIANMSAIDTQSAVQFLSRNKEAVWAANQSAQRSLPQSR